MIIWNSMISVYAHCKDIGSALELFRVMDLEPNSSTIKAIIAGLAEMEDGFNMNLIKQIHEYSIRNDIGPDQQLRSGLIEAYGPYTFQGKARTALNIFDQMEKAHVRLDGITSLGVLKAYSHAGLPDEAQKYFSHMRVRYGVEASSDHYACFIDVLSSARRSHQAYDVIRKMPVKVTAKAWGALLASCQTCGEVELAEIAGRALFEVEPEKIL
ncbi:hypothetical protein RDI58_023953 [Solanum bulbocastanum]|uniref:Pentatricopeptide repeat-containing protein n=1 Tax=Solanum bulbocastanum TaxID=147425 RepID=A0AAN8Y342_SOLBU